MNTRSALAIFASGAELLAALKGIITIPLVTRFLTPAEYGAYGQALALVGLLLPTITLASEAALIRFLPGEERQRQRRWFTAWCIALAATGTLVSLIVLWQAPLIGHFMIGPEVQSASYVAAACLLIWSSIISQAVRVWFRGTGQLRVFSMIAVAQAILGLLAVIIASAANLSGPQLIGMIALADVLSCLICLRGLINDRPISSPDFSRMGHFLRFSIVTVPAAYTAWCVAFIDRLVVVRFVGLQEAGFVALSAGLGYGLVRLVATPIYLQYSHDAAVAANKSDTAELRAMFEQAATTVIILCFPLIAGSIAVGNDLISIVAAPAYAPAALMFPIFIAAFTFQLFATVSDLYLQLTGRATAPLISAALILGVLIGLNLLLVPLLSFVGAACATAAAFLTSCLYGLTMARGNGTVAALLTVAWRAALASVIMLVACTALKDVGGSVITRLALLFGTGALVYLGLAWLPGVGLMHTAPVRALIARYASPSLQKTSIRAE